MLHRFLVVTGELEQVRTGGGNAVMARNARIVRDQVEEREPGTRPAPRLA